MGGDWFCFCRACMRQEDDDDASSKRRKGGGGRIRTRTKEVLASVSVSNISIAIASRSRSYIEAALVLIATRILTPFSPSLPPSPSSLPHHHRMGGGPDIHVSLRMGPIRRGLGAGPEYRGRGLGDLDNRYRGREGGRGGKEGREGEGGEGRGLAESLNFCSLTARTKGSLIPADMAIILHLSTPPSLPPALPPSLPPSLRFLPCRRRHQSPSNQEQESGVDYFL